MQNHDQSIKSEFQCGYIAIIGRPNVGKSTLLNHLVGQKISITAHKPQTTRHRITGIKSTENAQFIYVDTPGVHRANKRAINRYMNKAALSAMRDVDVVLFVIEALKWTDDDEHVLQLVKKLESPVLLVVNKIDKIHDKSQLMPFLQQRGGQFDYAEIVPVSARNGEMIEQLESQIKKYLPVSHAYFADDQITDRSERFIAAEIVREKLTRLLGEELPYALTVEIEQFKEDVAKNLVHISAIIWVEREGQKGIVIGKQGQLLKKIGEQARKDLQQILDQKVFLQLWVKVKEGWSDNDRALRSLGYSDDSY